MQKICLNRFYGTIYSIITVKMNLKNLIIYNFSFMSLVAIEKPCFKELSLEGATLLL